MFIVFSVGFYVFSNTTHGFVFEKDPVIGSIIWNYVVVF